MEYSLRKSRRILRTGFSYFQKSKHRLSETDLAHFETLLRKLDQASLAKEKTQASHTAEEVEAFIKLHFPKTVFTHIKELISALIFAVVVAFLIRQFWFSLYEVPTGSMRPTVAELDRMVVSKTTFGLHLPWIKKPLFYSDTLLKRAGTIVFSVEDMHIEDANMLYFGFLPGKKQYVKRCVAKPGDTIYFYGGKIWALDKEGKPCFEFSDEHVLQKNHLEKIDHVPYITMDGKIEVERPLTRELFGSATLKQMNLSLGKLFLKKNGAVQSSFFNGKEWVQDQIDLLKAPHDTPLSYSDLWGIGNYAMARLLTREQAILFYKEVPESSEALLYLELRHTPNLTYPKPKIRQDELGRWHAMITPFATLIPMDQSHLEILQKALITARFHVENGHAYKYHESRGRPQRPEYDPAFPSIPNGCYEFYYGIGYKIHFTGIRTQLPATHPLYQFDVEQIRNLFNMGIGFNLVFSPMEANQTYNPQRFAYFREGDLYVMGAPVLKKSDPLLIRFVQKELEKQQASTREEPYIAFVDHGPPIKEGKLDVDFIEAFGLKVPEKGLVALGDNYAMSADSRDFGFVPTDNLRGAPSFTFWPPSERLGALAQPPYPWLTTANLLIWSLAAIVFICLILWIRKRNRTSLF